MHYNSDKKRCLCLVFFEILSRIISLATIYIIYIPIIGGKTTAQMPSPCRRHTHPGKGFIAECVEVKRVADYLHNTGQS